MKTYRIRPLPLVKMEVDLGIFMYRHRYGEKFQAPTYCWYIEGADKHILVDTGTEAELATSYRGFPAQKIMTFDEALGKVGLKPEDIDIVIQTHLDWDHCANTHRCNNARVLVQEDELRFALAPHPLTGLSYKPDLLIGLNFFLINGHYEVCPGIELIPAPGHSAGTQAVSVQTEKGRAVISGFCCVPENFNPPENIRRLMPVIPPGTHIDIVKAFESTLRIKGLADILIAMHDPAFMDVDSIP